MGRKTRVSKGKTMKPNFFVFCEGETEIAYVKFLRSIYRVPIQIIAKKSDSNISVKYIENCKKDPIHVLSFGSCFIMKIASMKWMPMLV